MKNNKEGFPFKKSLNPADWEYSKLLDHVMKNGKSKGDRTGTGTISIFGYQMRFDLNKGFPMITTKKIHLKSIIYELLWFLNGDTNIKYLNDNGVKIWDDWANEDGDLGPIYGKMWRSWPNPDGTTIDQITNVIDRIKNNPNCRRLIVTAWNPSVIPEDGKTFSENVADGKAALAPCHAFFQFYVENGKLSCQLYQRSCDLFFGVPFNIASYVLLTLMIAQVCNLELGEFIWTGGDVHIYNNLFEQVKLQLLRSPRPMPTIKLNPKIKNIFDFKFEDFTLEGYYPHLNIKGKISV